MGAKNFIKFPIIAIGTIGLFATPVEAQVAPPPALACQCGMTIDESFADEDPSSPNLLDVSCKGDLFCHGNGITIATTNTLYFQGIRLDLKGFSYESTVCGTGTAFTVAAGSSGVSITNGDVKNWNIGVLVLGDGATIDNIRMTTACPPMAAGVHVVGDGNFLAGPRVEGAVCGILIDSSATGTGINWSFLNQNTTDICNACNETGNVIGTFGSENWCSTACNYQDQTLLNPPGNGDCSSPCKKLPDETGCCADGINNDGDEALIDGFLVPTPDCSDADCSADPVCAPTTPENCTGGVDDDGDGAVDCSDPDCISDPACDQCLDDPNKTSPGICGCGAPDADSDGDGALDCHDGCPFDPGKLSPGACGCGVPDADSDGDGSADCHDGCPGDPFKSTPGQCGCGFSENDSDGDGVPDCHDEMNCNDGFDNDGDGFTDCDDSDCAEACQPQEPVAVCDTDRSCSSDGQCSGCGFSVDAPDCVAVLDFVGGDLTAACRSCDPELPCLTDTVMGVCDDTRGQVEIYCLGTLLDAQCAAIGGAFDGTSTCGGDGTCQCPGEVADDCPDDPNKTEPGICGCGVSDADSDGDGLVTCQDNCPDNANADQSDLDGDGVGDVCDSTPHTNACTCLPPQPKVNGFPNHGQYLSCVVKALNAAGMSNRNDIKGAAVRSECVANKQ